MTLPGPDGTEVPASAIPEAVWGPSWQMRTAAEIVADDPFEGHGVRLEWPPSMPVTLLIVEYVTGCDRIVLFPDFHCAWVDLSGGTITPAALRAHWAAWLAPPEEVT